MKIVVVDDYPMEGETIRYLLKKYRPEIEYLGQAYAGTDGFDLIQSTRPDIAFVDVCMPVIDGLALTERVKMTDVKTNIVIVTAYDDFEFVQRALRIGASDYILKPIQPDELFAVIDRVTGKAAAEGASEVCPEPSQIEEHIRQIVGTILDGDGEEAGKQAIRVLEDKSRSNACPKHEAIMLAQQILRKLTEMNSEAAGINQVHSLASLYNGFTSRLHDKADSAQICSSLEEYMRGCANLYNEYLYESGHNHIRQVKIYIEKNLNKAITLESAAQEVYISSYYLSHLFKRITGLNFLDYLIELRIDKAKILLRSTNDTINSIALQTGYNEPNSFRRLFKKRVGVSPSDYRQGSGC